MCGQKEDLLYDTKSIYDKRKLNNECLVQFLNRQISEQVFTKGYIQMFLYTNKNMKRAQYH
jgi:hypothetical protein